MSKETTTHYTSPKLIERDEFGLIKGIEYKFTDEGLVDWRAMIPLKYLYINPSNKEKMAKKYGKPYEEIDIINDKVEDTDLVQLLPGTKYLLKLRGYNSIDSSIIQANDSYAAVQCKINFIPNFETENISIIYCENACATLNNTNGFGQKYLVEMATNRALARCVRSFLGINIVSKEEISDTNEDTNNNQQNQTISIANKLKSLLEKRNVSWEQLKKKLEREQKERYPSLQLEKCNKFDDLPKEVIFDLISRLKVNKNAK